MLIYQSSRENTWWGVDGVCRSGLKSLSPWPETNRRSSKRGFSGRSQRHPRHVCSVPKWTKILSSRNLGEEEEEEEKRCYFESVVFCFN